MKIKSIINEDDVCNLARYNPNTKGTHLFISEGTEIEEKRDYSNIANVYRPGHADYTYEEKFGIRDYRGGGRSSGRETIARVAGGAVASKILKELGITFSCYTRSIGKYNIADPEDIYLDEICYKKNNKVPTLNKIFSPRCLH